MLTIQRISNSPEEGTLGRMGSMYTIERPDLDNQPSVSRIPAGQYVCERRHFNKGGYDTFEIMDVPGRTNILFHIANVMKDVKGCVGLGTEVGVLYDHLAVLNSGEAFKGFMGDMEEVDSFQLLILDEDASMDEDDGITDENFWDDWD